MNPILVALDVRLAAGQATGDSTYWTGLLHGLAELESSCRFLLFSNTDRPAGIPESPAFQWLKLAGGSSRWWSLARFPLAARRAKAGAIHTQYNLSPLVGSRGITTIHDVSFLIGPEWFNSRDRLLLQRFVPASARRAKRVVTVSHTSKSDIVRFIPDVASRTVVAYNGPNPGIQPVPREIALRTAASLGLTTPFMLTVGTRWPRKNMKLAIDAVNLLPAELKHRLAITGKPGWGEENLQERAVATGYLSEEQLSALYCAADLYLAPSLHEGFGIPLLEAFECECPVVCSSGGALPEVAGDAAEVMASWEPADWARSIAELLEDSSKLAAMRARGKKRASEFSWKASAQIHEQVYREVAQ